MCGRAVIVTGASSGIGRAIAQHLGEAGFDLFLSGRSVEGLRATTKAIHVGRPNCQVHTESLDVATPGALMHYVGNVGKAHPYLFAIVNNAGVMHPEPILGGSMDRWRAMMDVNYFAALEGSVAAVEVMRAHRQPAHVINVSSVAANIDTMGPYAASKRALEIVTTTLRHELSHDDIRVTTLVPGAFATHLGRDLSPDMNARLAASAQAQGFDLAKDPDEHIFGDPAHLAKAVLYILSQPIAINIERMVLRPPIDLTL